MAANYPTDVFSPPTITNGDTVQADDPTRAYDEIVAVEEGLLNGLDHPLRFAAAPTLTIASGAVTVAKGYNAIETEGAAATDDLDTITAGANVGEGSVIILRAADVTHVVTLKDGTGNLLLCGDYVLDATDKTITLVSDGTNWREVARSAVASSGTWTPTIGGAGGQSGQVYSTQVGTYVKVGTLVYASFYVVLSTKGTITGNAQIQGLPFTSLTTAGQPVAALYWEGTASSFVNVAGFVRSGSTAVGLIGATAAAISNGTSVVTGDLGNSSGFGGTIVYRAAA